MSRELDKWIAENFFGLDVKDRENHEWDNTIWDDHESRWITQCKRCSDELDNSSEEAICETHVPRYSNDVSLAFKVVEKVKSDGFRLMYDVDYGIEKRTGWTVCISGVVYQQFCDSPSMAICLAAKKAFEDK